MFGEHAYEEEENNETLASCVVSKRFFSSYLIAKAWTNCLMTLSTRQFILIEMLKKALR